MGESITVPEFGYDEIVWTFKYEGKVVHKIARKVQSTILYDIDTHTITLKLEGSKQSTHPKEAVITKDNKED